MVPERQNPGQKWNLQLLQLTTAFLLYISIKNIDRKNILLRELN